MKNKTSSSLAGIFSNPIFFLAIIFVFFAMLFYFFGPKEGISKENMVSDYERINGAVTIVEYGDYQCPACGVEYGVVEQVLKEYGSKVKLEYRHYPLPFHEFAMKAAIAAECANDQGKFLEMHGKMYTNQQNLDVNSLKKYAAELGLDSGNFSACIDNNEHTDKINKQKEQGNQDGISGTPTFFINGKLLKNSENDRILPALNDFKKAVDSELGKNK